jgi:hypothetical protein
MQAMAGGSVLAFGATIGAVAAIFALGGPGTQSVPSAAARHAVHVSVTPPAQAGLVRVSVPAQFDPLVPYAAFGWLPKGVTQVGQGAETSSDATTLAASGKQGSFWLHVMATGGCGYIRTMLNCHWDSGNVTGPMSLNDRAPDVNGRPACWTDGDSVLWEYAPGAWAAMDGPGGFNSTPPPADQALLLKVAAGVRYGYRAPLVFPFWLSGLPASWSVSTSYFTESQPPVEATSLDLGPVQRPQAAQISVEPARGSNTCPFFKGDSTVTLDGVKAIVQGNMLCISDLDGQSISMLLITDYYGGNDAHPVPGAASIGGVVGLFRHLHLLGSQASAWTTKPLR